MAKRKDLLLKESTVSRMMGLAGIGALTNPFLREGYGEDHGMNESKCPECGSKLDESRMCECGYMKEDLSLEEGEDDSMDMSDEGSQETDPEDILSDLTEEEDPWANLDESFEDDEEEDDEEEDDEEDEEEDEEDESLEESINSSLKRLKRLLEQAEPSPGGAEETVAPEAPPADEGGAGGDKELEDKIKDFVKKLGGLVQDTLGVEVKVEEGEGEEEEEAPEGGAAGAGAPPPPAPAGGAGAPPPAPLAEAISRLVNKVARRVKARLMEAKDPKAAAKAKKIKMMKEKQMAAKKKEMEAAKKKKQMEMKKKKAVMSKKK